mgnify:CR=1 FL=1
MAFAEKGKLKELTKELKGFKKANKKMLPIQPGDVPKTWADLEDLKGLGYKSKTSIEEGVDNFVKMSTMPVYLPLSGITMSFDGEGNLLKGANS